MPRDWPRGTSGRARILRLDSPAARAYRRGMKTSFLSSAVFALLMSLFSPQAWADDLKAMDGTWKIEKAEAGGKVIEAEELKAVVVTIKDGRYEVTLPDKKDVGTLKLDEAAKPKTMDATVTEGFEAGKVTKAIYELNGDSMRVCYVLDGGARPAEFATQEGAAVLLITYKREK